MTEALQLEIRTLRALLDSERDPGGRVFAPLADAYRRAGQIPEALRLLRDGIAKHPEFVTGHVVAAQLYVEQGLATEGAIAHLGDRINADDYNPAEVIVEAAVALGECGPDLTGRVCVDVPLLAELGITVRTLDGQRELASR